VPFGGVMLLAAGLLLAGGWGDAWLRAIGLTRPRALAQLALLLVAHRLMGAGPVFVRFLLLYSLPLVVSTVRTGSLGLLSTLIAALTAALALRAAEVSGPPWWLAVPVAVAMAVNLFPLGARARLGAGVLGAELLQITEPSLSAEEGVQLLWATMAITSLVTGIVLSLGVRRTTFRPRVD
jgi:hypothetical protein